LRGENWREMGSEKERGKGGSYVKYLTLLSAYCTVPYFTLPFLRTTNGLDWACNLPTSLTLSSSTINEIFSARVTSYYVALIENLFYIYFMFFAFEPLT
jgi:hypothetical protein